MDPIQSIPTSTVASPAATVTPTVQPHMNLFVLWKTSLRTFLDHFGKLAMIALIPNAIVYALGVMIRVVAPLGVANAGSLSAFLRWNNVYAIVTALLFVTLITISIIGIVALLTAVIHREKLSFIQVFEESLQYIWNYLLQAILAILVSVVGIILGTIGLLALGIVFAKFSIELFGAAYTWLSLIPVLTGLAATVLVIFAQFSIIDKKHGPIEAIKYSMKLATHGFLRNTWYLFTLAVLVFTITISLSTVPVIGPILSLLTLTPFTIVYIYTLYASLAGIPAISESEATA